MNTKSHVTLDCCAPAQAGASGIEENRTVLDECCTPSSSVEASTALDELRAEETPADVAAIRHAGFRLLLETGEPVTVDDLIATTDVTPARVTEIFDSARSRGRVEFDGQGRLIGLAGLSLTPSRHQLTIDDNTRWTWCALDAVGILGALGATGSVRSTDPQTHETVEIAFTDGQPDADAHLFILGGFSKGNVREDWCPQVNFFASHDAAESWVAARGAQGDIVAVKDIAAEAAEMWRPVVDLEAEQTC